MTFALRMAAYVAYTVASVAGLVYVFATLWQAHVAPALVIGIAIWILAATIFATGVIYRWVMAAPIR